MFVITDLQTIFHTQCTVIFVICLLTNITGSLVTATKPTVTMLLLDILHKYCLTKFHIILTSVTIFVSGPKGNLTNVSPSRQASTSTLLLLLVKHNTIIFIQNILKNSIHLKL
jgi:hypothetical protein